MIEINDSYTWKYYLRYLFFLCVPTILYKLVLTYKYQKTMHKTLNLDFPECLSEKIQWIKLYGITDKKRFLTDKIAVKDYINKLIPELKVAKVYQIADSFKKLDFSKLPVKFILKTNHAWASNVIIEDKYNLETKDYKRLEKFFNKVLKINYAYWSYYELQYKNIKPKIYAEELLADCNKITDYEVFCFDGRIEFLLYRYPIEIDGNKGVKQCFFDKNFKYPGFYINWQNGTNEYLCGCKHKILEYAEKLCKDIDFVRVDFMEINNEIYFCEMTFTPNSGFFSFYPEKYDLIYGIKLKTIPKNKKSEKFKAALNAEFIEK